MTDSQLSLTRSNVPWPNAVHRIRGMAPGEMRLVLKATGRPMEELDTIDQAKATAFIGLVRWYRQTYDELPDPGQAWEAAEWTEVEVLTDMAELQPTPPSAAG